MSLYEIVTGWLRRRASDAVRREMRRRRPEYLARLEQVNAEARARFVASLSLYSGRLPEWKLRQSLEEWDANAAILTEREMARYDREVAP